MGLGRADGAVWRGKYRLRSRRKFALRAELRRPRRDVNDAGSRRDVLDFQRVDYQIVAFRGVVHHGELVSSRRWPSDKLDRESQYAFCIWSFNDARRSALPGNNRSFNGTAGQHSRAACVRERQWKNRVLGDVVGDGNHGAFFFFNGCGGSGDGLSYGDCCRRVKVPIWHKIVEFPHEWSLWIRGCLKSQQ